MATESSAKWRSSKALLIFTATLGLFSENFLYGFIVPLLPYMIETRLSLPPTYTQQATTNLLSLLGFISIIVAPIIGHLADLTASRKYPLLLSLLGCVLGTVLVSTTWSLAAVYAGRILQAIACTGAWIVGFAMLTDAAGGKHLGKVLGFAGSFIGAGVVLGPAAAGILLEVGGYWGAWALPFALLVVDLVARLLLVESKHEEGDVAKDEEDVESSSPLLSPESSPDQTPKSPVTTGFYKIILRHPTVWAAMFNVAAVSMILSGFDATLPLHLRDAFGWGPAPIGSIFLGLQIPSMCLAPFVGWLRDRIGLRWPTAIGWTLLAPLLWFSGVPGKLGGDRDGTVFVGCIVAIGIATALVRGAGTFQLTTALHELRAKDPHAFGPGGGSSRMFSLTEISYNVGLMLGPIVCGSLNGRFGFEYTAYALAGVAVFVGLTSCYSFTHNFKVHEEGEVEEGS